MSLQTNNSSLTKDPVMESPLTKLLGLYLASSCDGYEQQAFEAFATRMGLKMDQHPMFYLFTDPQTNLARDVWKAALEHAWNFTNQKLSEKSDELFFDWHKVLADVDDRELRCVFDEAVKAQNLPAARKGDGYRSSYTQTAWALFYGASRRLTKKKRQKETEMAVVQHTAHKEQTPLEQIRDIVQFAQSQLPFNLQSQDEPSAMAQRWIARLKEGSSLSVSETEALCEFLAIQDRLAESD